MNFIYYLIYFQTLLVQINASPFSMMRSIFLTDSWHVYSVDYFDKILLMLFETKFLLMNEIKITFILSQYGSFLMPRMFTSQLLQTADVRKRDIDSSVTGTKEANHMNWIGRNDKCSCKLVCYTNIKWYSHMSWAMFNESGFVLTFQEQVNVQSNSFIHWLL